MELDWIGWYSGGVRYRAPYSGNNDDHHLNQAYDNPHLRWVRRGHDVRNNSLIDAAQRYDYDHHWHHCLNHDHLHHQFMS